MEANKANILALMGDKNRQFIIPIYQRTYSWDETRCETLWNDIIKISKKKEEDHHFLGSVVCYQTSKIRMVGKVSKELVIDGQQRLTTLSLILIAIARFYKKSGKSDIVDEIYTYLINTGKTDDEKYKLFPTNQDRETYKALIDGIESEITTPSINMLDAFNLFYDKIEENEDIIEDVYMGIQKLDLVYIALNSESDNPQLIFESMNSTGMALTQGDLLRNYLLLGLSPEKQEEVYKRYWQPIEKDFGENAFKERFDYFLRDYLFMKTRQTSFRIDQGY